jgi:hypothetical protein
VNGPSKPEHVRETYDNGGTTADRYTVLTTWPETRPGAYLALGLSADPWSAGGFSQWTSATPGRHLGKRCAWADLPERLRGHIVQRMTE